MSEYNRGEAYKLSALEIPVFKSSAAPAIREFPEASPDTKVKTDESGPKTTRAARRKFAVSVLFVLKLFIVAAITLTFFAAILRSNINLIKLERESEDIKSKIAAAQSENTRLTMRLNSEASADKIDVYAVSTLGLRKLERYQIRYFENPDGDRTAIADGKAVADKAEETE